jgi:hypothetical protein
MKQTVWLLSSAVSALLLSSEIYASECIGDAHTVSVENDHAYETVVHVDDILEGFTLPSGWKVTGDIRSGYVTYDYSNDPKHFDPDVNKGHRDSRGFYLIPKISLSTPVYNGFSAKITGAAVTDFGINDGRYESRTFAFGDGASYGILQEAYIQYENGGHTFLAGAKEIVTPMVDADDWYLLANTFQGAYYRNKTIDHMMFAGGYVYKMAGVWDGGAPDAHRYHSIAEQSYVDQRDKENAGDAGMWVGVFEYADDVHNLQLWDYYAVDLYNTFFAQYDYKGKMNGIDFDAGVQLIDFQDVGGNRYTPIDYSIFSLKLDTAFGNGIDMSLGAAFYTDGPGTGATLGAWGGYPYLANGMIFHFFEAGDMRNADSYKVQLGYDLGEQGIDGLWIGARCTYFDLDPKYAISSLTGRGQDAQKNYGLRVSYNHDSGVYFTGTYEFVDLDEQKDISALRLIGGYKF